jgi:hypothetical protein
MISPIVTWDALTISKYLPHVEPKFLLLLLLLDVGSYFPRLFFDVFCPFYNVSLVNGSSILQTKETKQPKSSKAKKPEIAKATSAKKAQTIKGQEPKSQEGKAAKAKKKHEPATPDFRATKMPFNDIS